MKASEQEISSLKTELLQGTYFPLLWTLQHVDEVRNYCSYFCCHEGNCTDKTNTEIREKPGELWERELE